MFPILLAVVGLLMMIGVALPVDMVGLAFFLLGLALIFGLWPLDRFRRA